MPDTIKKRIGVSLCIIFACCLINTILERVNIKLETSYISARQSYGLLADAITVAAILYIGFNRKINSNIVVKIGASLLSVCFIISTINCLFLLIKYRWLIEFTGSVYLVFLVVNIISLLLFYWGTKTWMLIKVAITCGIIPLLLQYIAFRKLDPADDYEIYEKNLQSYIETADFGNILFIVIYAVSLILTIIWLLESSKKVSTPAKVNQQAIKESNHANKSELINKIPHK